MRLARQRAGLHLAESHAHLLNRLQAFVECGKYPVGIREGKGRTSFVFSEPIDINDTLRLLEYLDDELARASGGFPGLNQTARLQAVEDAIEKVFRRSMDDNPGPADRALARDSIQRAALVLSTEARTPALREFWSKLVAAIELAMYP